MKRTKRNDNLPKENRRFFLVDPKRIELSTSALRTRRSPERHAYTPPKAGAKIVLPFVYYYTHVYMSKYADFVKDFEKWEDEEMNAAETAYYIEVQSRVSNLIAEAKAALGKK